MSHSHIQVVQQGLELLQAQGLALSIALQQILQEGGCGHSGAVPARPDPRAGEEAEQQQEQAAAPGAHAGDHGASGMLREKPQCCWIWHSQRSNHGCSTPPMDLSSGKGGTALGSTQILRRNSAFFHNLSMQDHPLLLLLHPHSPWGAARTRLPGALQLRSTSGTLGRAG